jgi:hypothetical protein
MRPLLGLTQYLHQPSSVAVGKKGLASAVLLGSCGFDLLRVSCVPETTTPQELLTLKATGSECGFFRRSVCDTSCWKGPVQLSIAACVQC